MKKLKTKNKPPKKTAGTPSQEPKQEKSKKKSWYQEEPKLRVLECSSKGDKRFSAFYAKVTIHGDTDSIENWYQLSKRFGKTKPSNWKDAKGREPSHIELFGKKLDRRFLDEWYAYLWLLYLDENPDLVTYAKQFDEFTDMFKGKSLNSQADMVRVYVKKGRKALKKLCQELIDLLKSVEKKDTRDSDFDKVGEILDKYNIPEIEDIPEDFESYLDIPLHGIDSMQSEEIHTRMAVIIHQLSRVENLVANAHIEVRQLEREYTKTWHDNYEGQNKKMNAERQQLDSGVWEELDIAKGVLSRVETERNRLENTYKFLSRVLSSRQSGL